MVFVILRHFMPFLCYLIISWRYTKSYATFMLWATMIFYDFMPDGTPDITIQNVQWFAFHWRPTSSKRWRNYFELVKDANKCLICLERGGSKSEWIQINCKIITIGRYLLAFDHTIEIHIYYIATLNLNIIWTTLT